MSHKKYIVALDQGTTSSRAIVFDHDAKIISSAQREFKQHYPHAGWVEHDPLEIFASQISTLTEVLAQAGIRGDEIAAIGITNQRETAVVWNKRTGKPIYNAIVWQCRRTADQCEALKEQGHEALIKQKTGLVLDPYFSASKIQWILDNVPNAREQAEAGDLLFGTIDTWLIWKLTQGRTHVTDYTNASRTMLFNINSLEWDSELLRLFNIPESMLPKVADSSSVVGHTDICGIKIPIAGVAGDQQAALFGHLCVDPGQAKNTYGTGCFLLMNTGETKVDSGHGLLTTLACNRDGKPAYALEGAVFMGGSAIQWLRDEMRLIPNAAASEQRALSVPSSNGVYVIPAFTGLGAPYWDAYARGTIVGLSRGSNADHIIRATLESIAYQTRDVLDAMQADAEITLSHLRVDGGAVANNFLMQFQSDVLNSKVLRPKVTEVTALGAAYLAGLAVNFWETINELADVAVLEKSFEPCVDEEKRARRYAGWQRAVGCARYWSSQEQEQPE